MSVSGNTFDFTLEFTKYTPATHGVNAVMRWEGVGFIWDGKLDGDKLTQKRWES